MTVDKSIVAAVHIVGSDIPLATLNDQIDKNRAEERFGVHNQFPMVAGTGAGQGLMILPHAPNRVEATITITGLATDTALLCGSQGDTDRLQGAIVQGGQFIRTCETTELWAVGKSGSSIVIGVHATYRRQ